MVSDKAMLKDGVYTAQLLTYTDYYPFGMAMPGSHAQPEEYRYGFNGKEKDNSFGLTNYDYGFRIYNPAIGKFLSVDPLSPDYPWYTPYQLAGNKPIKFIDLDGLEEAIRSLEALDEMLEIKSDMDVVSKLREPLTKLIGDLYYIRYNDDAQELEVNTKRINAEIAKYHNGKIY